MITPTRVDVTRNNDGIPEIEFPWPPCPVCDKELWHDGDGWDCHDCNLGWDQHGRYGKWQSEKPACGQARDVNAWHGLTTYAVCHLDHDHATQEPPLPHAGYDPADVTDYSGPTDWIRWDDNGKQVY